MHIGIRGGKKKKYKTEIGVRGKYRVKYATGKTYHVRNFALIPADRPWGEGDEEQKATQFGEGTRVQLTSNVVFTSMDTVTKGTTGVVTYFGAFIEVLAAGMLFAVEQEQIELAEVCYLESSFIFIFILFVCFLNHLLTKHSLS